MTRAQALAVMSRGDTSTGWLRSRDALEPVRRGVYRMAGVPETWEQQLLAACLAAGPEARASFRSAAALHGLEGFVRDTLRDHALRCPAVDRSRGSSSTRRPCSTSSTSPGSSDIPVTSVARTLCDLTAGHATVDRSSARSTRRLRRKLVRLEDIVARRRTARRARPSSVHGDARDPRPSPSGLRPGESDPERRIADLLVRAGLPEPTMQHPVEVGGRRYRIDLCYPEHRIAIEYDGWEFHSGRQAFDDDRARANDLVLLGFVVLRFTSKSTDQAIVDTVRAADRTSISRLTVACAREL